MNGREFGNPIFTEDSLGRLSGGGRMTRTGVSVKLAFLLAILFATGAYQFHLGFQAFGDFDFSTIVEQPVPGGKDDETVMKVQVEDPETGAISYQDPPQFEFGTLTRNMWIGLAAGFVLAMIVIFVPESAPILAPFYAACEGLVLGGISVLFELQSTGITIQAIALTFAVALLMLVVFASGLIKVTGALTSGIIAATGGVCLLYFADLFLSAFFGHSISLIHSSSIWGIGFSVFVCGLAAFNLLIDFSVIEEGIASGSSKRMEWYCAFSVLVTLVWLYLEILRLLAKVKESKMLAWTKRGKRPEAQATA